jgi:hypothetical protein
MVLKMRTYGRRRWRGLAVVGCNRRCVDPTRRDASEARVEHCSVVAAKTGIMRLDRRRARGMRFGDLLRSGAGFAE